VLLLSGLLAPPAQSLAQPGGPLPPPSCLDRTVVNSMSVDRRSTLGGTALDRVRFSWNITKGCADLELWVAGRFVAGVGSMDVSVPTSRRLTITAKLPGCCSTTFRGPFVLAARFVHYAERSDGSLGTGQPRPSSGSATTDAAARAVLESMRPSYRASYDGKRVEIHVLPRGHRFGELPPWDETDFVSEPGGLGSSREDAVLDEHGWWGPGASVHSVGIGAGSGSYAVTHELGHAALLHAGSSVDLETRTAFGRRRSLTPRPEFVGCASGDDYGATNHHEYWAEGTAALFDVGIPCPISSVTPRPDPDQYTPEYLATTDPALDHALRQVFDV
jgi:hypothetical protein